ncbi:calponin homology domain-containing protein DDB_G0272472-like isoform X2 [Wyeomyia smithii]|nr:calponin homology domain-containing protein DDB_G0272472-like isoform X2 [Wyeomyia smithii]XP_055550280.1 calponin homology domain-containing protein DDB_G0272472-like isoform X2 [Wyeomyia smithii]XP_055550281.1 calponin homology domain-containing protein DDB_G0272472-like isoform X2 [Wyeomyia smithii]
MIQLKINNCDEIRTYIQQKCHEDTKRCQLAQIEDKQKLEQSKREEDRLWQEVHLTSYKAKLDRELDVKQKRNIMERSTFLDIQQQIKDHSLKMTEDKKKQQQAYCTSLPFPDHDEKLVQIKKTDLAEILRNQIACKKSLQMKQQAKEQEVVKVLNEGMQRELDREKAALEAEKQVLKKQIDQYYNYSKGINKQRQIEENKMDKLIQDARQHYDDVARNNCKQVMRKRQGLADKVYNTQQKQIAAMNYQRRLQREEKLQEGVKEREIYEQHLRATIEAEHRAQLAAKEYRELLKEQMKSGALEQQRRKHHDQMQTNRLVDTAAQELKFVETFVKGSFENHIKKHPNVSLLKSKF